MMEVVQKIMSPLTRRVHLMISRCKLSLINDTSPTQGAQAEFYTGEIHDDAQIWQNFGLTSVPLSGSEGVALFIGGERQSPLIIATENKDKRKEFNQLKEGEVCVYSGSGDSITLKEDNKIELKTKSLDIASEEIKISGNKISLEASQILIGKDTELITVLMDLCDALAEAQVTLSTGAMVPLSNSPQYKMLKTKLNSFKGVS